MPATGITVEGALARADGPLLEEQAYAHLRRALVEGVFAPGDKLPIRRIAVALGTSPMPVRSALRRLAAERALDVLPSGTAMVPRLTRAAFAELGAIRAALEPLAVRLAAAQLDHPTFEALDALLTAHRTGREEGSPEAFLRADRDFLFTLYRASGAPMLLDMIEALWLRRGPIFWEARWVLTHRGGLAHRHEQMLSALRERRGDDAAEELRLEIESATAFLLAHLRFLDDPPAGRGLAALPTRGK
jgi:GntR family colanic acid and biofilm gene transcriptional regulator